MTIERMEHVGIVVDDLQAAKAFFVELGMNVQGDASVGGELVDRIVGLEGIQADIVMLETPGGDARVELVEFKSPRSPDADFVPANVLGLRHLAFKVDDLEDTLARVQAQGAELVGTVENYANVYRLCYIRGPGGSIVELAERIG